MRVDGLAIDDRLAVAPIIVEITHALPRHLGGPNESGQEMRASPDLGPQPVGFDGGQVAQPVRVRREVRGRGRRADVARGRGCC